MRFPWLSISNFSELGLAFRAFSVFARPVFKASSLAILLTLSPMIATAGIMDLVRRAPRCEGIFVPAKDFTSEIAAFARSWKTGDSIGKEERDALDKDPRRAEKQAALEKLGYEFPGNLMLAPTFEQIQKNFDRAMDEMNVAKADRIEPAMVFFRRVAGKTEFRFVRPGKDPYPTGDDFRIYDFKKGEMFSLPWAAIIAAIREGRFPLLEPFHDGSHFASFVAHPEYMVALKRAISQLGPIPKGSSAAMRFFVNSELLSLADSSRRAEILALLKTPEVHRGPGWLPLQTFANHYASMSDADVLAQARVMRRSFDGLVRDYGAGPFHSYEKSTLAQYRAGKSVKARNVLTNLLNYHRDDHYSDGMTYSFGMILGRHLDLLIEADQFGISQQDIDSMRLFSGIDVSTPDEARSLVRALIREELARAEFFLWNTSQISIEEWIRTTMVPVVNPNAKAVLIWRDFFGDDITMYRRLMKDQPF